MQKQMNIESLGSRLRGNDELFTLLAEVIV